MWWQTAVVPFFVFTFLNYAAVTTAQYDPLKDFCRRFSHQTAVVDDKLYIDGGFVNWKPFSDKSQDFSNPFLLYSDLGNQVDGMPVQHAGLSKNASIPSVSGGILWEDAVNKRLYLYGGDYYQTSQAAFILYSYDILEDNWVSFGPPTGSGTITPTSYGAGVSLSFRGEAFYYGGWVDNTTASNRLVKYTMDTNSFSSLAGPDDIKRAEGIMVFLPIGDAGMLIYFGGGQDKGNGTFDAQPLDKIFIYDIGNTKWYTQKTTGRTPEDRRLFCGGATWAQDQSSYNIYIYGGAGFPPDKVGYDDIYILSIPSFQWIRGPYPPGSNVTGAYPKRGMSCNVVNNAQMVVIGGTYSNDTTYSCDADSVWGQHNMNLGEQNDDKAIWALYQPSLTSYVVPTDILTAVGGAETGGAKTTAPVSGFDAPDLSVLMTRKATINTRSATRDVSTATATPTHTTIPGPDPHLSGGAIAGIVVGSVAGIAVLLAGCCLYIRRRQSHYSGPRRGSEPAHQQPGGSTAGAWGGSTLGSHTPTHSPYTPSTVHHVMTPPAVPPVEMSTHHNAYFDSADNGGGNLKYDHSVAWVPPAEMQVPVADQNANAAELDSGHLVPQQHWSPSPTSPPSGVLPPPSSQPHQHQ
ncbi:hypothetical protein B0H66DRAFT_357773 [Apodospora peruviana]|uniref:Cell wall anchored protein n=1 Tax=Apodospora peruviana TaxID=516989 RepID=A0AAE0LZR6_9PEZI|nr:hypothetical protein B0H66DRAFT_357773 [Apodospora peruviana]